MSLPITTVLVSLLSLWLLALGAKVIDQRRTAKIGLDHGDDEGLKRKMRAMANFTEYTPFVIALFFLAELQGANKNFLIVFAALYLLSRIAHGYAMAFTDHFPKGRYWGTIGTWLTIIILALNNLAMSAGLIG
ncbi:MAG: MAPEG family protein [Salaquimonas sp.]